MFGIRARTSEIVPGVGESVSPVYEDTKLSCGSQQSTGGLRLGRQSIKAALLFTLQKRLERHLGTRRA